MSDTKQKQNKPNRAERRARVSRERHLAADVRASNARFAADTAAKARRERIERRVEAARKRKEARDAIRAEIAKKEGVSVRRVVLNGEGVQYTIRPDRSAEVQRRVEERKKRQARYDRKMTRRAQRKQ